MINSCDWRSEKSLILTMSFSPTLPMASACNIFLHRHFKLVIFSSVIGINERDDQHQNKIQHTSIWFSFQKKQAKIANLGRI